MDLININKKKFTLLLFILLFSLVPIAIICSITNFPIFIFIYLVGSIIGLSLFYTFKIQKPFKENVIPLVLKEYKPTLEFIPKLEIKDDYIDLIKTHKLIPSATTFNINDGIVDEINGYKVTSFDLHATHTQSNGKSSTTVTDFKGRFYDIEFDKLNCDFIIKEEILKRMPIGYSFLEFEHIEFNKAFNIYVTDEHEAFKVFTPSVIKKYYELAGLDDFKTIVHYHKNHLYVYLYNSKNIFENTGEDYKQSIINDYKEQYEDILKYIETFKYYKLN